MNTSKKYLISIVGPTAIGKTSTAIDIATHFDTEIISADSRQFFKEMNIGTAKPTPQELNAAKHHFVDFLSIETSYSAGQFEKDAIAKILALFETKNIVVVAGGSGLYVNAIVNGIDDIPSDIEIRKQLNLKLKDEGLETLQKQLKELDPEHFENCNIKNPQRVIRALEVCLASGKTYSSFRNNQPKERSFETITIGLTAEREIIYDRINQRVDIMMQNGLIEEVEKLIPNKDLNALNTVGYKELFSYFNNELSLENAIESIKKNTRNFAKRQLTWFKKNSDTFWFDINRKNEIIPFLQSRIKND